MVNEYKYYTIVYQDVHNSSDKLINKNLNPTGKPYPYNMKKLCKVLGVNKNGIDHIETRYVNGLIDDIRIDFNVIDSIISSDSLENSVQTDNTLIDNFTFLSDSK